MHSIMVHPLWWPPPQRLAFLIAVSDRVEGEDRAVRSTTASLLLQVVVWGRGWVRKRSVIHWCNPGACLVVPQEDRTLYQALECCAQDAIGPGGSWAASMDSGLVNNLGQWHAGSRHSTGCYMHAGLQPSALLLHKFK